MKITVFGAAGNVGSRILNEALCRGHEVTAVVRDPTRFHSLPAAVTARVGNADNSDDVAALSMGQDLVITATRPAPGREHELLNTTKALLEGVSRSNVRLLIVGGAASLTVPDSGGLAVIDDPHFLPAAARAIAQASFAQLEVCRAESRLDWVYLSPPAQLVPGARTGHYRLGRDELLLDAQGKSCISMEDLAVVLLDEAERPQHHQTRFTAAY